MVPRHIIDKEYMMNNAPMRKCDWFMLGLIIGVVIGFLIGSLI